MERVCKTHQLSQILKRLMTTHPINDLRLSQATGVPSTTIARLRASREANPTISSLRLIASFFGVSIGQLLGDEPLLADQQCYTETEAMV